MKNAERGMKNEGAARDGKPVPYGVKREKDVILSERSESKDPYSPIRENGFLGFARNDRRDGGPVPYGRDSGKAGDRM